jgi:hypothetical protein
MGVGYPKLQAMSRTLTSDNSNVYRDNDVFDVSTCPSWTRYVLIHCSATAPWALSSPTYYALLERVQLICQPNGLDSLYSAKQSLKSATLTE